jgi:hypothetical protein
MDMGYPFRSVLERQSYGAQLDNHLGIQGAR